MMKRLRFLISLHTRENDFQVAQGQSAVDSARKLGSDAEIVFATQSADAVMCVKGRDEQSIARPEFLPQDGTPREFYPVHRPPAL
jgi:hypothetical protein